MVDEVNQKDGWPELPPGERSTAEEEELAGVTLADAGVAELESRVAQRDEELVKANGRLIELEQVVAGKDSQITALKQFEAELEQRLTSLNNALAEAVASYKAVVVQSNPEVIDELISGDTIESISESLSRAKALVSKVKQGLETEISLARIPAGAPERRLPDLSALSPREKIQYAIGGFSS